MIHRKATFFLGIFIFLIPFLGLPSSWKTMLTVLSGLALIALSINIVLPRKPAKGKVRKERVTPVFVESVPIYPPNSTTKLEVKETLVAQPDTELE